MKKILFPLFALCATPILADAPKIEGVQAQKNGAAWTFSVTLSHPDTGWDHYADGWRVLDMEGNVLATRVLHHPHVNEQPFTRSQSGIDIPKGADQVQIQARDNLDGWATETVVVFTLP
ncbi:hypothetical protein SAMN04488118_10926 [Epibacterium ulvae]|uniref:Uncharacterized protein n=1 Tax=Epibacterium ulvae TaxID=1156985 RepID=A0A1G5R5G1_9RHOB|nr:hypothetical protein [Epibacterium ulvae]SCZ69325.1 hypothetical protein SAMN04488118_10926 [Epibacterium ulvae]